MGFVLTGLYAAACALDDAYREIRRSASSSALADRSMDFAEFNTLIGADQRIAEDERYKP